MRACCARALEITADGPDGPAVFTRVGQGDPVRRASCAPTSRASDDPAAELGDQETLLPKLSVGDLVTADGPLALDGARAARPRDGPAGALHRCVAGEAARGRRHRPAVDLRLDHLDDRAARLRLAAGQGARADLHGLSPSRACSRSTSPRSSSSASPARSRRASTRSARASATATSSSTSSTTAMAAAEWPGLQAPRREPGADRLPLDRARRASRHRGAGGRPHRALRPVRPARRGRRREDRVHPRRHAPGRSQPGARDRAGRGAGEGSGQARRRPGHRHADLPDDRPLRPVRPARRDARAWQRRRSRAGPP